MPSVMFVEDGVPCVVQRTLVQHSGWHLLVGCLMLNRTRKAQAERAMEKLFTVIPSAYDAVIVDTPVWREVEEIIRPCGLWRARRFAIQDISYEYVDGVLVSRMKHCGRYAMDSWAIFKENKPLKPEDVEDHELKAYLTWRRECNRNT